MTNSSKRRKYTYYERNWYDDFGNADNTTNQITRWTINFRVADSEWQGIQWDPTSDDGGIIPWQNGQNNYDPYYIGIEFIEVSGDDDSFTTNNPAVFETEPNLPSELKTLENVVSFPHLGSATIETRIAMGDTAINNALAFFEGKDLPNKVV